MKDIEFIDNKNASPSLTIIVQSTDSFSDCWRPFFKLFSYYWPECKYPILLNTETKTFSFKGLNIESTGILRLSQGKWPTWSESLLLCLGRVSTDIIFLILDDFFISGPVDIESFEILMSIMVNRGYSNITLTEHGNQRPALPTNDPYLLSVEQKANYRLSTSPALWRKDILKSYLRDAESAWEFEIFGSRRAWRRPDTLFIANPAAIKNGHDGVIPYFQCTHDTGIVKGRWQHEIKPFFEKHGIDMDYSVRGFNQTLPGFLNRYYLLRRLLMHPMRLVKGLLGR
jgi:hypothetical protein